MKRFKKLNTKVVENGNMTEVWLHGHKIVEFDENFAKLDACGWYTVTTKRRMNQVSEHFDLGFAVYQENFAWFVDSRNGTKEFDYDGTCEVALFAW